MMTPNFNYFDLWQWITKTNVHYAGEAASNKSWYADILQNYPIFLFYLVCKLLEIYFANRASSQLAHIRSTQPLQVPPPSAALTALAESSDVCSLCGLSLASNSMCFVKTTPNAFHYKCLTEHVEKNKRCPHTGYELQLTDIKRVYFS